MNKDRFVEVFIFLLWLMLVDALIFGALFSAHWTWRNSDGDFNFLLYLNRIWAGGILYLGIKNMFGYYPLLLAYIYVFRITPKKYSLLKLYPGVIAIFFLSASTFLAYDSRGSQGSWPRAVNYEAPFGNAMYISLFASLAAPFIMKVIATWWDRRKRKLAE